MARNTIFIILISFSSNLVAQADMAIPRIVAGNTIESDAGVVESIDITLNPFVAQAALDSFKLLHARMSQNLAYGALNGISDSLTVQTSLKSNGTGEFNGQVKILGNSAEDFSTNTQTPALLFDLSGETEPHRNTNFIQFEAGDNVLGRVEGMNMQQEWASYGDAFQNVLTSGAGALVGTVTNSGMGMISGATSVNDNNAAYDVYSNGQSPSDALSSMLGTFTTAFGMGLIDGSITLIKDIVSAIMEIYGCFFLGAGADDLATTLVDVIDDASSLGLHVYGTYGWIGSGVVNGGIALES